MASAPVIRPTGNVLSDDEWRPANGASTLGFPAMLSARTVHLPTRPFWSRTPLWPQRILGRLMDLMNLPLGWDTYGAPPVSRQAADRALELLMYAMSEWSPMPDILPGSDGGVLLEWFRQDQELRLDVPPDGAPLLFYRGPGGEWEGELNEAAPDIRELLFRVARP